MNIDYSKFKIFFFAKIMTDLDDDKQNQDTDEDQPDNQNLVCNFKN